MVRGSKVISVISGAERRSEVTGRDYYHATSNGCKFKITRVTESEEEKF